MPWNVVIDCRKFDILVMDFSTKKGAKIYCKHLRQKSGIKRFKVKTKIKLLDSRFKRDDICVK
jgi:hypothetical protein